MKKGWKIFLIVCGSVFVAGLALCITGAAMGATFSGLNSAFGYAPIYWDDDHDYDYDYDYDDNDDHDDINGTGQTSDAVYVKGNSANTFEFSSIQEIEVDASYLEIDVNTYDQDMITVDTSELKNGLEKYVVCKSKGKELKIETTNRRTWENLAHKSAGRMVIWIPEDLAFLDASFDVGAGYLKIEDIEAGELSLSVGAGKMDVKNFDAGTLDAECGAGQSILTGTVNAGASVDSGVGETRLTLNGNQNDYDYELKCDVGQLVVGNEKYTGLGREQRINNGTGRVIEIDCGIGNVEVTFNPQN